MSRIGITLAAATLLAACSNSSYQSLYLAEQGDYDGALEEATSVSNFAGRLLEGDGFSCRDHQEVITLQLAREDFSAAAEACESYRDDCSVQPENGLCFTHQLETLRSATSDEELAAGIATQARERLHFRWLMIKDDYEGEDLQRPIY